MKKFIQFIKESVDPWKLETEFQDFVWKTTAWYDEDDDEYYDGLTPNQIYSLADLLKKNEKSGEFILSFTDEVKDGRSGNFEINDPLKLNGKTFNYKNISIKINEITYDKEKDPGDNGEYSRYIKYFYTIKCEIFYG